MGGESAGAAWHHPPCAGRWTRATQMRWAGASLVAATLVPRSPPATKHPRQTSAACRHARSKAPRLRPDAGSCCVPCARPRHALSRTNYKAGAGVGLGLGRAGGDQVTDRTARTPSRHCGAGWRAVATARRSAAAAHCQQQQRAGRDAGKRRHAVSGRHWHGLRGRGGANAAVAGDDLREAWVREKAGPNRVMSWYKTRIWQAA